MNTHTVALTPVTPVSNLDFAQRVFFFFIIYYIPLETTGDPCNLIRSQQCD